MNRFFKLLCEPDQPDWYLNEFLNGRARFGWSGPNCDLRVLSKTKNEDCTEEQLLTWSKTKFLYERVKCGDFIVIQIGRPIQDFLIAEVVSPGYEFLPGNLDDFNHVLHVLPLTKMPIPVNSNSVSAALKHDLSKRGHYYEIYPEGSIAELTALISKSQKGEIDFSSARTDEDTLDLTLADIKKSAVRKISRQWPAAKFEVFVSKLLQKVDYVELKSHCDSGKGWDLLIRILNPITNEILVDNVPVQCKNFTDRVETFCPIDDLERSIRNSNSNLAYLVILGDLSEAFLEEFDLRQERLKNELQRDVRFELINEDRIAELCFQYLIAIE